MINNNRPNIILITADQWRGDCLGFLRGRQPVMTPHLNQLASEGVFSTQAYADCPVCMPQRMTVLTGKSGSRLGLTTNFNKRAHIDSRTTLPFILAREAGYQTKAIGKMHFYPDRARFGFEHVTLHPNDYVNWLEETEYAGMYRGHGLGGNEVYPAVSAVPERYTHTHWIVDQAIRFLSEKDSESPFFLSMIFEAPHSPFDPPQPYDRMYDNFTIPDPVYGDWVNDEDYPLSFKIKRMARKYDQLDDEVIRESRRRYYGQISYIDYQLGRLFGELQSKGLYNNTLIIFTSDHGEHLGDHGLFCKSTFLRGSADVPFIIKFPKSFLALVPGLEINIPVLTADIFPTVLDLVGLKPDQDIDGISLLPYIQSGTYNGNRTVFGEFSVEDVSTGNAFAFAANSEFKYIYYVLGGVEQLFNIKDDPYDMKNLVGINEYDKKNELKESLLNYLISLKRPITKDGNFAIVESHYDEHEVRSRNEFAYRGPLRFGQGYDR